MKNFHRPHLWLLRFIGLIVPRRLRADWRQEWEAELQWRERRLAEWNELLAKSRRALLWHSCGAFLDALWLQPKRWEDEMMQDLRFGARMLWKQKSFTAVAVLTLCLGIGANTAVFSLINVLLLKPISGREPDRMMGIYSHDTMRSDEYRLFSHPNFLDLRAQGDLFEDILAINFIKAGVTEGEMTRPISTVKISANYFSVFGVQLAQGRAFLPQEETQPSPVAIVSYRWWQEHGASPDLIGRSMRVNGQLVTIVGIAPKGFTGTNTFFAPDLMVPLSFPQSPAENTNALLRDRKHHDLMLVGRLKPGVTSEAANARLQVVSRQLAEAYPGPNHDQLITIAPLPRMVLSSAPQNDRAWMGAVGVLALGLAGLVLAIACLNLANMLMARGAARRKEFALRQALGAGAGRLLRQLLTEGFLLALLGGMAGITLAAVTTDWLVGWMLQMIPFSFEFDPWPDARVLGATMGFCVLATLFFALGPALKTVRLNVNAELKENTATTLPKSRRGWRMTRNLMSTAQIAISLCLLIAAGLAVRGAMQAVRIHPGFDLDRGFYLRLDGSLAGYNETEVRNLYRRITERITALPGVEAASLSLAAPFGEVVFGQRVQHGGMPHPAPSNAATPAEGKAVPASFNVIGAEYFRALGVPLLQGREFRVTEFTDANAPPVAIINSALAEKLWPGQDPVGRTLQFAGGSDADTGGTGAYFSLGAIPNRIFHVVGVVPAFKDELLRRDTHAMAFIPFGQQYFSEMYLNVRGLPGADLDALNRAVREEVRRLDPALPMLASKTMRTHLHTSVAMSLLQMGAILFGIFGAVALLLSLIGVYGLNAYVMGQRTREIGIRMALGADRRSVLRLLLRQGLRMLGVGLGLGLVLAAFVAHSMRGLLFEVQAFDPWTFLSASILLAAAVLLACYLPARRATRIEPLIALRQE